MILSIPATFSASIEFSELESNRYFGVLFLGNWYICYKKSKNTVLSLYGTGLNETLLKMSKDTPVFPVEVGLVTETDAETDEGMVVIYDEPQPE